MHLPSTCSQYSLHAMLAAPFTQLIPYGYDASHPELALLCCSAPLYVFVSVSTPVFS